MVKRCPILTSKTNRQLWERRLLKTIRKRKLLKTIRKRKLLKTKRKIKQRKKLSNVILLMKSWPMKL